MYINKIFNTVNSQLRSAVKSIGMGGYINTLSDSGPLLHEMNSQGNSIAFTNCNIFDGIHSKTEEDMTVLVIGDQIAEVGHKEQIAIPDNFFIVDAVGQTIMPGLIDSHVHLCSPFTYEVNISAIRQMKKQIALNHMQTVFSGVTTVCDMGGPQGLIKEFQKLADENEIPGPRYLNCYTLISPSKGKKLGYPTQVKLIDPFQAWLLEGQVATRPQTVKDLKKVCYKIKDDGGTHIKTTYQPHPFSAKKYAHQDALPIFDDDWMRTILRLGKETGMAVSIHSPFGAGTEKCVDLAIEVGAEIRIQHMTFDTDLNDTIIRKMHDYGYYIIPTVMVYGDSFEMPKFVSWLDTNPESYMTPEACRQLKARIQNAIDLEPYSGHDILELDNVYFRKQFDFVRRNTQKAHDAGIIGFGTDIGGTYTGFFGRIFSEVMHYAEFGIPMFDILKYLTSINARINGIEDRGVIQPRKIADLILLKGNPLTDPSVLKDVSTVMKGGVFLKYKNIELTSS
ncbi:MAG: amidohydrolase family protein [Desulfobacteraceae bacterium]|jgi:imidazolonepropionase-like amidohydrolase|nr:amidohydrolase family protein [Desulfobacteraceae bacterium]